MAKKVTNAQMGKAIKEFNKKFKMKPQLATEGTDKELKKLLYEECIVDIKPPDEDEFYPAKFTKATIAVVDALITEKVGKAKETPKEDKEEEKTEKEAPAGNVSLLDQVKGEMKKKVLIAFVENEDAFKADKKRLLKVKNHLSMRKEMVAILTADAAPADVTTEDKKEKKKKDKVKEEVQEEVVEKNEVVIDPLIVEVKAAGKKKELKKIAKSDKKFKKVDLDLDVDALRKAMLKALGVKKEKKQPIMRRFTSVALAIRQSIGKKKGATLEQIMEAGEVIYVNGGGTAGSKTDRIYKDVLAGLVEFGILKLKDEEYFGEV